MPLFQKNLFQNDVFDTGAITVPFADAGVGSDSVGVVANIDLTDAGLGADSLQLQLPFTDPGIGGDVLDTVASSSTTDAGAGGDNLGVTAIADVLDSAVGDDSIATVAFITLSDEGVGSDEIDNGFTYRDGADNGTGADELAITANIELADSAEGSDTLLKSFPLPPIVDFPISVLRSFSFPDQLPISSLGEDQGKGTEDFSIQALLAAKDSAEGKDAIEVDKHYPQLEAFHWLLAA